MRETRTLFISLFIAALLFTVAVPAWADVQQYVVVYGEFKAADTKAGSRVLDDLATRALASAGVVRFDVLQQLDRPNFFALFETWSNQSAYEAFLASSDTQAIFTQLAPLLQAPLDERDGTLIEAGVPPGESHTVRQIFVITHVDIIPTFLDQAKPFILQFVADSASDPGVQTFIVVSWDGITNHFQLIEVFADQRALDAHFSAQHTVDFRTSLQPFIGSPYDERLYQFVRSHGDKDHD